MEHTITAPEDGVLTQLDVSVGQQVEMGAVLARVEARRNAAMQNPEPERGRVMSDTSFIESPERQALRKVRRSPCCEFRAGYYLEKGSGRSAHRRIMAGGRRTRLHRSEPS